MKHLHSSCKVDPALQNEYIQKYRSNYGGLYCLNLSLDVSGLLKGSLQAPICAVCGQQLDSPSLKSFCSPADVDKDLDGIASTCELLHENGSLPQAGYDSITAELRALRAATAVEGKTTVNLPVPEERNGVPMVFEQPVRVEEGSAKRPPAGSEKPKRADEEVKAKAKSPASTTETKALTTETEGDTDEYAGDESTPPRVVAFRESGGEGGSEEHGADACSADKFAETSH